MGHDPEGFRVRFEKVPLEGGDYTMNHTAGVFLFDARGALASIIDYHEPREFALPKIRRAMAARGGASSRWHAWECPRTRTTSGA